MSHAVNPRDFTPDGKIIPDRQDIEAVDRDYGKTKSPAELYRLAQALKLARLFGP